MRKPLNFAIFSLD